jgi:predicted O-linked N-acetylglucosamine transferase (SPINDLY family)
MVRLQPGNEGTWRELGSVLRELGRGEEAVNAQREVVRLRPEVADGHYQLGNMLGEGGRWEEAREAYREAIRLQPEEARFWNNYGAALVAVGRLEEAESAYGEAIRLRGDYAEALSNRGAVLKDLGRLGEAAGALEEAVRIKPGYGEARNNLGVVRTMQGKLEEAEGCFREALRIRPEHVEALNNLGVVLKDNGELAEALGAFREAERIEPAYAAAGSNYLYGMHFDERFDARAIRAAHEEWARRHAAPLKKEWRGFSEGWPAGRRLRLGYVSPDFRGHAVGLFLLPLFAAHDYSQFEVFCYSDVLAPDGRTAQLRGMIENGGGTWGNIVGASDEKVAELIRGDGIDVLVDLTMHMARNRMLVFARKPAPVQVTWLGYCSTTGLEAMDYRLSDPHFEPEGADLGKEGWYVEKTIRLPGSWWCYAPGMATPGVGELPAMARGGVTFGCLNNFSKVSRGTLETWGALLREVEDSRLMINAPEGAARKRVMAFFEGEGIGRDRVSFVGYVSTAEYFARYGALDIALDPFPYGGGTTTLDGLWMGVPAVTLAGRTAVGRGGVSILRNVGLGEMVAASREEYVAIAAGLARDVERLRALRRTMRERLRGSVLMDAVGFARGFEGAVLDLVGRV